MLLSIRGTANQTSGNVSWRDRWLLAISRLEHVRGKSPQCTATWRRHIALAWNISACRTLSVPDPFTPSTRLTCLRVAFRLPASSRRPLASILQTPMN